MSTQPLAAATEPNVVWSTDFKGQFRVAGRYCYPLTLTDNHSRFLLSLEGVDDERETTVRPLFELAFAEYGLPLRMRSDNGPPFASRAVGGLSQLSIWWIKLGITPERIEPGHPEQNGRHERMHRTLKAETTRPPMPSREQQQAAFDRFRKEYNEERPHEALGQKPPITAYKPSPRTMPTEVSDPEYPIEFLVRRIHPNGCLSWGGTHLYLSKLLSNEAVGVEEIDDGVAQLWFGPIYLGLVRQRGKKQLDFIENKS